MAKTKHTLQYPFPDAPLLMLDAHPSLRNIPAFADYGAGANDCWLRFSMLYADKGSEYRDLPVDDKKKACLREAGVPDNDERIEAVLAWTDPEVFEMVRAVIRQQGSLKYALWSHGTEAAWQTIEKLSAPIEDSTPPKIIFHDLDVEKEDGKKHEDVDKATLYLAKKIQYYGKAIVKMLALKRGGGAEMDEGKIQLAYKTRRDNLDAMFEQVPMLEKLAEELFMSDEALKVAGQQALLRLQPSAERRAEGRQFVPTT